jgi:hypothetical protein
MPIVSVDAREAIKVGRDMQRNAPKVQPRAEKVVARFGHQVVATGQVLSPVDLGNLRNSIGVDVDGLAFEAGPTANYGGFVEEGTDGPYPIENAFGWGITVMHPGISPSPYMGPAYDKHLPRAITSLARASGPIL